MSTRGYLNHPEIEAYWNRADYERIKKKLEGLAKPRTIQRAINRSAKAAASFGAIVIAKGIAKLTTLKYSQVKKSVKPYCDGGSWSKSIGIKIYDTPRPLSAYKFSPNMPKYRTAPVVEIYKGSKKKFDVKKTAFVAKMQTGHIGIYEREGEKRKSKGRWADMENGRKEHVHIRELKGPGVTSLFRANEEFHTRVYKEIMGKFEGMVEYEVGKLLEMENPH
jgi:hypothetical protein